MSNKIKGRIFQIATEKVISEKFRFTEVVLETFEQYPQFLTFQFANGNSDKVDSSFMEGDIVDISYNLKGIKYQDKDTGELKLFNKIDGWRIEKEQPTYQDVAPQATNGAVDFPPPPNEEDLPF